MPTVITVPMLINFPKNSHAYGNLGAYTYSEGKSTYAQYAVLQFSDYLFEPAKPYMYRYKVYMYASLGKTRGEEFTNRDARCWRQFWTRLNSLLD